MDQRRDAAIGGLLQGRHGLLSSGRQRGEVRLAKRGHLVHIEHTFGFEDDDYCTGTSAFPASAAALFMMEAQ
jgi:hypothetical protein